MCINPDKKGKNLIKPNMTARLHDRKTARLQDRKTPYPGNC